MNVKPVNVKGCSRCGVDHDGLKVVEMVRPFSPPEAGGLAWTHWAPCPTNGDPILLIVSVEGADCLPGRKR